MDWFNIFKIGETASLAPVQELADRLVIRNPGVFIPDRNREKFEEPFGSFWSGVAMIAGTWDGSAL